MRYLIYFIYIVVIVLEPKHINIYLKNLLLCVYTTLYKSYKILIAVKKLLLMTLINLRVAKPNMLKLRSYVLRLFYMSVVS